jgi:predicted nuclease of predicted toxin-antitoxin system
LPDEEIIEKARQEGRIILTHDLDFGRLIALSQEQLPSVITFRLDNMQPALVNHYLVEALTRFEVELTSGVLVSINEQAIRARAVPIK